VNGIIQPGFSSSVQNASDIGLQPPYSRLRIGSKNVLLRKLLKFAALLIGRDDVVAD